MAMVQVTMAELDKIIAHGPKPDLELSIRYGDRTDVWFDALMTVGLVQRSYVMAEPYLVDTALFANESSPSWELARTLWEQRVVAHILTEPPSQAHSETSRAAGASMRRQSPSLRSQALELLRERPMTDVELAKAMKTHGSTARPRRIELVNLGLVEAKGTKQGPSGRLAQVWGVK